MRSLVLTFSILLLSNIAWADIELSSYETVHLEINMPDSDRLDESERYLTGLLIGYLRGVENFTNVQIATKNADTGVLLRIDITDIKVRGFAGALVGALSGKDKLAGNIKFVDLESGNTLAKSEFNGSGKLGFAWNVGGANIHTAVQNFCRSLFEWANLGVPVIGSPKDWRGKVEFDTPISVECTGITSNTAFQLKRNKQNDETFCASLIENLEDIGVSVEADSSTVLSLTLEAFGTTGSGKRIRPVLIMRWRIDGPLGAIHNDIIATARPPGEGKRKPRDIMKTLVQSHAEVGVLTCPSFHVHQDKVRR